MKRPKFFPTDLLFWLVSLLISGLCQASSEPLEEKGGADVFVTSRAALLRETASPNAKVIARLPAAMRVTLLEGGDAYLHVELPADSAAAASGGMRTGFLAAETTAVFDPGAPATADMVTVGRTLARNPAFRTLGTALLARGVERLRQSGSPDARAELALAEAAAALATDGGPFPAGLPIVEHGKTPEGKPLFLYTGDAFQRALDLTAKQDPRTVAPVRERALVGLLRSRFPQPSDSLTAYSGLALGRLLVAAGRLDDLSRVGERTRAAAGRVSSMLPDSKDGAKLAAKAAILISMRGDGTRSFPQESRVTVGGKQIVVRIDGELGKLKLLVQTSEKQRATPFLLRAAVPVLPIPGSLRVSPDGRSAAWVELAKASALLPVMISLDKNEPAREIAFLSSGRPLRDRALANVVSSVTGYSSDSRRLGVSILAWDDTPGPSPRLSVVSAETGELLFETSKDLRQYKRLLQ